MLVFLTCSTSFVFKRSDSYFSQAYVRFITSCGSISCHSCVGQDLSAVEIKPEAVPVKAEGQAHASLAEEDEWEDV